MIDRDQFEAAVAAAPLDHGLRCVYADWLDENGDPDLAARQRQWVESYEFIKEFTTGWHNSDLDDDGNVVPGTEKYDYAEVMGEVDRWRDSVENRGQQRRANYSFGNYDYVVELCFDTTHAQEALRDAGTRRRFWECFRVLTGAEVPADIREQEWYRCAC